MLEILDDDACSLLTAQLRDAALPHSDEIRELASELVGVMNDHLQASRLPAAGVVAAAVVLTRALVISMPGFTHTMLAQIMLRMGVTADIANATPEVLQ